MGKAVVTEKERGERGREGDVADLGVVVLVVFCSGLSFVRSFVLAHADSVARALTHDMCAFRDWMASRREDF